MSQYRSLYVTTPTSENAVSIARALVEAKLVACVNILPPGISIYRWQDQLTQDSECLLFAKTTKSLVEQAITLIKSLHPYEVPCILSLSIETGYKPYLDWVSNSCQPERTQISNP